METLSSILNKEYERLNKKEKEDSKKTILAYADLAGDGKTKYINGSRIFKVLSTDVHPDSNSISYYANSHITISEVPQENANEFSDERFKLLVKYAKDERSLTYEEREKLFKQN